MIPNDDYLDVFSGYQFAPHLDTQRLSWVY